MDLGAQFAFPQPGTSALLQERGRAGGDCHRVARELDEVVALIGSRGLLDRVLHGRGSVSMHNRLGSWTPPAPETRSAPAFLRRGPRARTCESVCR